MKRHFKPRSGAEITATGIVFRLWAPNADAVEILFEDGRALAMQALGDGWYEAEAPGRGAGTTYSFRIGGAAYPDPAARAQQDGVSGPSVVFDPGTYDWQDTAWRGTLWTEIVIYELHIGTFSSAGTFDGAIGHLDHLQTLGVNAIEIMPVAAFAGRRNWGYDGVLPYAVAQCYGGPDGLKRLVEACHARGISVILDVVYNHFGPEGNYLHSYADAFFTEKHETPWGAAINYDDRDAEHVRRFFIENALFWLTEYHLDGLRLDAVHSIKDDSDPEILLELGQAVRAQITERPIHLILENDANRASLLGHDAGAPGPYTAQWNDDFHHAIWVLITGRGDEYYVDYQEHPAACLGRALAEGFVFQGQASQYRKGRKRGEPSAALPPGAFVSFIQNHDQVGNHAYGWRVSHFAPVAAMRAAAAVLLLSPHTPMLWQGEEWNSGQPFPFFCDFHGELADAVRQGRIAEFGAFEEFSSAAARALIPDPLAEETFLTAILDWESLERPERAAYLDYYRSLIAIRRDKIVPALPATSGHAGSYQSFGRSTLLVSWRLGGGQLTMLAQLSAETVDIDVPDLPGEIIFANGEFERHRLPPWLVAVSMSS